jgi:hypothetical protein
MDCVFWAMIFHSICYKFLILKYEVPDVHVGTLVKSNDVTLFENIFFILGEKFPRILFLYDWWIGENPLVRDNLVFLTYVTPQW